jgi:hypothetical protein
LVLLNFFGDALLQGMVANGLLDPGKALRQVFIFRGIREP